VQGLTRLAVALGILLSSSSAAAQDAVLEAPAAEAPSEAAADDVATEGEEASPDDADVGESDATAEPEVPRVRVHVRARRPGVEAHVRLGSHVVTHESTSHVEDDYTLLCAPTPCDADVPSGTHLFAVSASEGTPLPVHDVDLTPGVEHTLEIDLDDRSGWRTMGTLVALLVGIPGLVILLSSLIGPAVDHSRIDAIFVGIGAPLTAIGIAGIPFAAWGDTRTIELVDEPAVTE
jgi:hypothetical protein